MAKRSRKSSTKGIDRLGRAIAERPPQPITAELSGELGKIVAERIAGVAPEQRKDVAQRTIIEILLTTPSATPPRPEVPLTGLLRRHVAQELARLWIPKREQARIYRQRRLKFVENLIFIAKWGRKTKAWARAGKPRPKDFERSALETVAKAREVAKARGFQLPADMDKALRFPSRASLDDFLKRERRARKKPQP
jgi:hypothetical protein